ncbi:MAG: hypothetical protein OXU94_07930 [Gammaproteobacteria bacterium]|nr:hypothetical protein [Gammaproteobacteria bacterium]
MSHCSTVCGVTGEVKRRRKTLLLNSSLCSALRSYTSSSKER